MTHVHAIAQPINDRASLALARGPLVADVIDHDLTVSFTDPAALAIAELLLASPNARLFLDNGEFEHFVGASGPVDAQSYWDWAGPILDRNQQALAIIPDGIRHTEAENLALIVDGMLQRSDSLQRAVPVWHIGESLDQLHSILEMGFDTVGIGTACRDLDPEELGERLYQAADLILSFGGAGEGPAIHIMSRLAEFLLAASTAERLQPHTRPVPAREARALAAA